MALAVCAPAVLLGATRLVTTTGADAGDCTVAPCATLTYAIGQAVSGDTIDVGPGSFANGGNPVNVDKTLIVRGEQFGVDARNRIATESLLTVPVLLAANNVIFDGVTVTCGSCTGVMIPSLSGSGSQIRNNILTGNSAGLALYPSGATQSVVQFNWIHHNNVPASVGSVGSGINGSANNTLIDRNLFANHGFSHVYVAGGTDVLITNNEMTNATGPWGAVIFGTMDDVQVSGNVITGGTAGINNGGNNTDVEISGNVVDGIAGAAMLFQEVPTGGSFNDRVSVTGNQFINSATGIRIVQHQVGGWEIHFNRIAGNGVDVSAEHDLFIVADMETTGGAAMKVRRPARPC